MDSQIGSEAFTLHLKEIYNCYRTSLYNRLYYGCQLEKYRVLNKILDVVLAVGSSSVIGGWLIWKNDLGVSIWGIISGITALLAIVKPIMDLPKKIERYSKLFVGHGDVFYDIQFIVSEIKEKQAFTEKMKVAYRMALNRRNTLSADDDATQNPKISWKCYESVNNQIPPDSLWMPSNN